jgi:hypothetical protein
MPKAHTLEVIHEYATDTYKLINLETGVEITLPKKLTPEMHKVVRLK